MTKCEICKYQENCPDIVEFNSVWCIAHRKLPKNFGNEYIKKQQLISFLEERINLCDKVIKEFSKNYDIYWKRVEDNRAMKMVLQEVLDFVNKGGKDE